LPKGSTAFQKGPGIPLQNSLIAPSRELNADCLFIWALIQARKPARIASTRLHFREVPIYFPALASGGQRYPRQARCRPLRFQNADRRTEFVPEAPALKLPNTTVGSSFKRNMALKD
jgi:hypothetical protein